MNLIDRYVSEVGRHLLLVQGRQDIEKELRSTLEDMLEERARESGKPADDAMQMEMLREYGAPRTVAETYNPNPYLIGPRLYPMFTTVLKFVLAAVALGLGIATAIQIANASPMNVMDLLTTIGKGLLNIVSASIAAFGNIALIFALIERFVPTADIDINEKEEWDPASLLKEPEPSEVKLWEPILAIVFTFIAISILNFNPQVIGIYYLDGNEWNVLPLLSEAFFRWLPLMNVAWAAEIILKGLLLRSGCWTTSTRLFSIGIKLLQIVIFALLIAGPSVLALTADSLSTAGINNAQAVNALEMLANQGMRIVFGLAIFGTVVEIIKLAAKMLKKE